MRVTHLVGMHGIGDCLHERAIVKHLLQRGDEVWLETSWPQVFHDLVGPRLHFLRKKISLRTQNKNADRFVREFHKGSVPANARRLMVWYTPEAVRQCGSVLKAMLHCSGVTEADTDFRLRLGETWLSDIAADKPILLYRPLVERTEWSGCAARNPDAGAYGELIASIRDSFFVVSVADLVPGVEWQTSAPVGADMEFHRGELNFESLAALTAKASLTFASPGFATILAQAVGTPSVCVFGGYEDGRSFTAGAQWTPHLAIDPIKPCPCFRHDHNCDKRIDIESAKERLKRFVNEHCSKSTVRQSQATTV